MEKAGLQRRQASQQPTQRHNKGAARENPQGGLMAKFNVMAEHSPQAGTLKRFVDMANASPAMGAQRKALEQAQSSPPATAQLQEAQSQSPQAEPKIAKGFKVPAQAAPAGLPDKLKSGIEALSGISMESVQVHYNSAKPAQLNAHAYAQGTEIHISPGQEKYLPHEAWHVVQQAQGRVHPTPQRKRKEELPINDDLGLEKEADEMGNRAISVSIDTAALPRPSLPPIAPKNGGAIQRAGGKTKKNAKKKGDQQVDQQVENKKKRNRTSKQGETKPRDRVNRDAKENRFSHMGNDFQLELPKPRKTGHYGSAQGRAVEYDKSKPTTGFNPTEKRSYKEAALRVHWKGSRSADGKTSGITPYITSRSKTSWNSEHKKLRNKLGLYLKNKGGISPLNNKKYEWYAENSHLIAASFYGNNDSLTAPPASCHQNTEWEAIEGGIKHLINKVKLKPVIKTTGYIYSSGEKQGWLKAARYKIYLNNKKVFDHVSLGSRGNIDKKEVENLGNKVKGLRNTSDEVKHLGKTAKGLGTGTRPEKSELESLHDKSVDNLANIGFINPMFTDLVKINPEDDTKSTITGLEAINTIHNLMEITVEDIGDRSEEMSDDSVESPELYETEELGDDDEEQAEILDEKNYDEEENLGEGESSHKKLKQ